MSKVLRLPERPKPPTFNEIQEDIEKASEDDVVYTLGGSKSSKAGLSASVTMEESFLDLPPLEDKDTSVLNDNKPDTETNNISYEMAVEFVDIHKKLQTGPQVLQEQYDQLEVLRQEVSESIDDLKKSAETFMKNKNNVS